MTNNDELKNQIVPKKKRHIVYVDASSFSGSFKIGLYDKTNKAKHTLALGNSVKNINNAEQYAVLYGLMYIQKKERDNLSNYVLMNDCENAIQNQRLISMGKLLQTRLIWIPREINKADKVAKSKANRKKKLWKNLDFFMKIILNSENLTDKKPNGVTLQTMYDIPTDKNCEDKALKHNINELSTKAKMVYDDIIKNYSLFPMRLLKLSPLIVNIINNRQEEYKQGDSKKILQELCGKKILIKKKKTYYLE